MGAVYCPIRKGECHKNIDVPDFWGTNCVERKKRYVRSTDKKVKLKDGMYKETTTTYAIYLTPKCTDYNGNIASSGAFQGYVYQTTKTRLEE